MCCTATSDYKLAAQLATTGNLARVLLKWLRLHIFLTTAIIGLGVGSTMLIALRLTTFSGKVVLAKNHLPVQDALVVVDSGFYWEDKGSVSYVRTDEYGRFRFNARGHVSIQVWKGGFAMAGVNLGTALNLIGNEITIEIRELKGTNTVPMNMDESGFTANKGFSFDLGKVVNGDSPYADIRMVRNSDNEDIVIEALENGGLFFQPFSAGIDFYNTPEAPPAGYSHRLPVFLGSAGLYYVRTRDGKRFAKFRLSQGLKNTPDTDNHPVYWLLWAYQPDGTRDLEIAVSKEYAFPFEKFGISRDTLK